MFSTDMGCRHEPVISEKREIEERVAHGFLVPCDDRCLTLSNEPRLSSDFHLRCGWKLHVSRRPSGSRMVEDTREFRVSETAQSQACDGSSRIDSFIHLLIK